MLQNILPVVDSPELTLSHPMMPYGIMVSHKLMGIYMGLLMLYYSTWFLLV